jgi:AraC family transcriptional regulator, regulatory protein of adaptative response / DNA-3-methyladenine glycosylase II
MICGPPYRAARQIRSGGSRSEHAARYVRALARVRIRPVIARACAYADAVETFAAVVTTGIYCRPGCGAKPRRENVKVYQLAAAAEADGYRACLRCRPYRSAQPVSWVGPEFVCRAVQLILDGALDQGTEADLGARLGVSARHLRRLFTSVLGVTPDALARSARAHFARRLLDDTDVAITDIAFIAGFGSLRQFNRTCQDIFRASPRDLRARRRKADRLAADGGLALRLPYLGPLDWEATAAYFAAHAIPGVESVAGSTYRRTVVVGSDVGVLELAGGGHDHVLLRAHLPHWEELVHVVRRARRIASLDLDVSEPARHLMADRAIGPLLRARPGLRPPGTWDAFETGVRAIIGQGASPPVANAIAGRLVEQLGKPVPGLRQFGLTHAFPAPDTLAGAGLGGLGLSHRGAAGVRAFARAVCGGSLRLDRSIGLDRLVSTLTAVDGVSERTAHYLALRLGEPDAFPLADRDPQRAGGPRAVTIGATPADQRAEHWRPWRALALTHLWAAARTPYQAAGSPNAAATDARSPA